MKKHGGDIYSFEERTGCSSVYDFSANINPFGVSDRVREAVSGAADKLVFYPDPMNRKLVSALSRFHHVSEECIVCGNGGSDVIYRTASALSPRRAVIVSPVFTEYRDALESAGAEVKDFILKHPFRIDSEFLAEAEHGDYDLLVICNPNNPTGTVTDRNVIGKIAETALRKNAHVLLDECFFDMTGKDSEQNSMIRSLDEYPNLIVVKSMTKMYALPGLRLGYAVSADRELVSRIRSTGQPWPVNTLASEAGAAALGDDGYRTEFLEFLETERKFMYDELVKRGFEVWEPGANFIFFRAHGMNNLVNELSGYGIMIRQCSDYTGLNDEYYRICVRKREENIYLLECLDRISGNAADKTDTAIGNENKPCRNQTGKARSLLVTGTMSNSGKSFVTAGLCRVLKQDGYRTAPFKSQNMALNSYITRDGLEMGRAQVMQAEAAGAEPDIRMNPVLLKPTSEKGSQVIVCGEVLETMDAKQYYSRKQEIVPHVMKAYNSLAAEYDVIVLEGAGSPAEINLKDNDIVNMGMAKMSRSPVILVGDIDRGGVFASVYGTWALMDDEEKKMLKGIIINKFRGDVSILEPGLRMIEELTGLPVLGVIPYIDIDIDDEDSLSDRLNRKTVSAGAAADIAVIRLPRISNFTDFDVFSRTEGVSLRYISDVRQFGSPDMIIIPGTKSTMADLRWMRQNGIEAKILQHQKKGVPVAGICGGYQMLGRKLCDPDGTESGGEMRGMELLDITTVFRTYKHRAQVSGKICSDKIPELSGSECSGYEIHMGETTGSEEPFTVLGNGDANGHINHDGTVFGTYLHGFFDSNGVAGKTVSSILRKKGVKCTEAAETDPESYREQQYDRLADCIRKNIDMNRIYEIIERGI